MNGDRHPDRDRVQDVCKIGQGAECCRYLMAGGSGFECAKKTSLAEVLDARVETGSMAARGDNCPGLPLDEET